MKVNDPDAIQRRIAIAAYLRAESRSFAPGHEVADWLAAEAEIEREMTPVAKAPATETPAAKAPGKAPAKVSSGKPPVAKAPAKPRTKRPPTS